MTDRIVRKLLWTMAMLVVAMASHAYAIAPPVWSHQTQIAGGISSPARVAVDAAGNIYVADENRRTVTVLGPDGAEAFAIGGKDVPRSVAVDRDGRIIVGYMNDSHPGYVAIYDASGQFAGYLGRGQGEFGNPSDIAVSHANGRIYVLDNIQNRVKVYDKGGAPVTGADGKHLHIGGFGQYNGWLPTSNPGQLDFPSGVAVDDVRREILVSDQNNYRVQIFDVDGNFRTAFGQSAPDTSWVFGTRRYDLKGRFSSIRGLAVDKDGRIYVADAFQGVVQVLDRNGIHLAFIGAQGNGAGQLNVPTDVVIDNQKRLIVADWNNNRLSLFQLDTGPAIGNDAPPPPVQVSPADAVQLGTTSPLLIIYNATDPDGDALRYRFEVDMSPSFTTPLSITAGQGMKYTSATAPPLTDHTVYFWRARAEETATADMLASDWSGTRSFYLNAMNRPPGAPWGLLPSPGSTVRKSTELNWSASTDPDLYDTVTYVVEISTVSNFSSILISQAGIGGASVRLDSLTGYSKLKSGSSYHWRVRALDNHGASSAYSAAGRFVFRQTILRISTTPPGARIYVDGNYGYPGTGKGDTSINPNEITDLEAGRHVVRIEKEGYFGYYTSVVLTEGATRALSVTLTPERAGQRLFVKMLTDSTGAVIGAGNPTLTGTRPFVVDWDNDGKKDLLSGDAGGRVYLYMNTSSDASPGFRLSTNYPQGIVLTAPSRATPFVVDWDGDGRKDLLVGLGDGTVRLYPNIGSDESPAFDGFSELASNGAVIQCSGNAAPFVADWNGDGRKDLLVGESSGKVRLYINTGTDTMPVFGDTEEIRQGGHMQAGAAELSVASDAVPFVTDWNNDGKKDIVAGGGAGLLVFLGNGTNEAPSLSAGATHMTGTGRAPFVLDYNNDRYSDLLLGEENGGIGYYMFKGN